MLKNNADMNFENIAVKTLENLKIQISLNMLDDERYVSSWNNLNKNVTDKNAKNNYDKAIESFKTTHADLYEQKQTLENLICNSQTC